MGADFKAKIFTHGGSQAVRLPKAFRFKGTEVRIRKEGDKVILEPVRGDLATLWAKLDAMGGEAFPDRPPQPDWPPPVDFGE